MVFVQLYAPKSRALSLYCTNVNQYPAVDVNSQAAPVDSMSVDNHGLRHHSLKHVILYFTTHMFHNHSRPSSNRIINLFHQFSWFSSTALLLIIPGSNIFDLLPCGDGKTIGAPLQASVMRIVRLGLNTIKPGIDPHHQQIIVLNLSYRKPLSLCKIEIVSY